MSETCTILDEQTATDLGIRTEKRALTLLLEDRLPWSLAERPESLAPLTRTTPSMQSPRWQAPG